MKDIEKIDSHLSSLGFQASLDSLKKGMTSLKYLPLLQFLR